MFTQPLCKRLEICDDHHQPPEAGGTRRFIGRLHELEDGRPEAAEAHPSPVAALDHTAKRHAGGRQRRCSPVEAGSGDDDMVDGDRAVLMGRRYRSRGVLGRRGLQAVDLPGSAGDAGELPLRDAMTVCSQLQPDAADLACGVDDVEPERLPPPRRVADSKCPELRPQPASSRARVNMSSSMASVSFPVNVFCWLG